MFCVWRLYDEKDQYSYLTELSNVALKTTNTDKTAKISLVETLTFKAHTGQIAVWLQFRKVISERGMI